jgi:hypothetical protein
MRDGLYYGVLESLLHGQLAPSLDRDVRIDKLRMTLSLPGRQYQGAGCDRHGEVHRMATSAGKTAYTYCVLRQLHGSLKFCLEINSINISKLLRYQSNRFPRDAQLTFENAPSCSRHDREAFKAKYKNEIKEIR